MAVAALADDRRTSLADLDANAEERRNVTQLIRWLSGFVAWPAITIGLVMLLDAQEHLLHIVGFLPVGTAALVVFWMAPRIAARFYPPE